MSVEWFNKPPGTDSPTPPHQDNYYFCLRPPSVLTIWLALDPVDEENGCLRYVAGSHRQGIRAHARSNILGFSQGISDYGDEDRAREVVVRLQAGRRRRPPRRHHPPGRSQPLARAQPARLRHGGPRRERPTR